MRIYHEVSRANIRQ